MDGDLGKLWLELGMLCPSKVMAGSLGEESMRRLLLGRLDEGVGAWRFCPRLSGGGSDGDGVAWGVTILST